MKKRRRKTRIKIDLADRENDSRSGLRSDLKTSFGCKIDQNAVRFAPSDVAASQ
jgi:hypothetical protein